MFYNTNKSDADDVRQYTRDFNRQESDVLVAMGRDGCTPFEVEHRLDYRYPITSIRRAMTNLTELMVLEKTDEVRQGKYGKKNHVWRRVDRTRQGTLQFS